MCACATYTSCRYYLKAAFISLRASVCVATIEGGDYLRVASIQRSVVTTTDDQMLYLNVLGSAPSLLGEVA